ncbi:hypothetical protein TRFO_37810 [Tritrichomonas foetus]|uniref:Peptidase M60 domain-containing protein n=1 Tax=Tritrichomonas foetus TaxID=1144522 RepID=A0A1J4JCU6_9EUKA|nr:hypothetical protein TRFO_37810 [Tritrichomonas foetus]|eukprot:OHS96079.1 hypothetical protein TRFO_37810 [Tritrichomonas foetus]
MNSQNITPNCTPGNTLDLNDFTIDSVSEKSLYDEKKSIKKKANLPAKKVNLTIFPDSMVSTGYYVSPGEVCMIKLDEYTLDATLFAQIGSHNTQLYTLPGPWHRWPSVVSSFALSPTEENYISSPFGGILYFLPDEMNVVEYNLTAYITNASVYPYAFKGIPDAYQKSKDSFNPWGEIECSSIAVTMPTDKLMMIPNVIDLWNHFDSLIFKITEFMNFPVTRPFRLVFDVDMLNDDIVTYPINLHLDYFDDIILNYQTPTYGTYKLLEKIALLSIRDNFFDEKTELALAALVAAVSMKTYYKQFHLDKDPKIELPFLFREFWAIHNHSADLFQKIFEHSQTSEITHKMAEEKWIDFVSNLSKFGKYNFTNIFQKVYQIPRDFDESVTNLPEPNFEVDSDP